MSEQRNFRADPMKLKRLRVTAGMTSLDFAKAAMIDRGTAAKILRGDAVLLSTLKTAVKHAFGINDPLELLHPEELHSLGINYGVQSPTDVLEWRIIDYLTPWIETSNGLQYQVAKLKHRYLPERFARARCYELRHMSVAEREQLTHQLHRHAAVCENVESHPNLTQNLTATWVGGLWWVLDRWHDGDSLSSRLAQGRLSDYELLVVMKGIASALTKLHSTGIICRELAPKRVLLLQSSDRPILTDLELAKVAEASTVSPSQWPDDPYRALEVCGGRSNVDERADIYSWARIFVHAATGILPSRDAELPALTNVPDDIAEFLCRALTIAPTGRPKGFCELKTAFKRWT